MGKTRKEKEAEIIAQMEEALKEQAAEKAESAAETPQGEVQQFHCRRCKALMENGKCPACGYSDYVPMDAKMQKKIRWILTGICLLGFLIIFLATR